MKLQEFLNEYGVKFPGNIVFARIWGSVAYNTALPTSDCDFSVVYAIPPKELLSLYSPSDTITSSESSKPDYHGYDIKKFCNLLIKGNPGLIECLFTEKPMYYGTSGWEDLRLHRKSFLTTKVVKSYLGYVQGQLHRIKEGRSVHSKGGEQNEKHSYHMLRLAQDAYAIAEGGEPTVYRTGSNQKLLMDIRNGIISIPDSIKMVQDQIDKIDSIKPWKVPDKADATYLSSWLLKTRGLS
jgi:predicted nucleotidyltransferase